MPFPSPGDLPDPGIEPRAPALWADALPSEPPGKPKGKASLGFGKLEWISPEADHQTVTFLVQVWLWDVASLVAQRLKRLPAMWETWVQSLGQEDPLVKDGNPLHYSCLEKSIDGGACRLQSMSLQRVRHD